MKRLFGFLDGLKKDYLKRDDVIEGLMLGLLTQNNVLLVGPPGTAKSMLVNDLAERLEGITYFNYLMTRFTRPDEIIGPISLKGLERDEFTRVLEGRLGDAHLAFLDEVFYSNSGCLNAILNIMNEKKLLNGTKVMDAPLIILVGATNELPAEINHELSAFYDRFLLKYRVDYLDLAADLEELISRETFSGASQKGKISFKELRVYQQRVKSVILPVEVLSRLVAIVLELRRQGLMISDRKVKQSCQALKALAMLRGREQVVFEDLGILKDIFWLQPDDQQLIVEIGQFFHKPVLETVSHISREAQKLYEEYMGRQGQLGFSTQMGSRLLELKEDLLNLQALYSNDLQLAGAIGSEIGRVDTLTNQVFENLVTDGGGNRRR